MDASSLLTPPGSLTRRREAGAEVYVTTRRGEHRDIAVRPRLAPTEGAGVNMETSE